MPKPSHPPNQSHRAPPPRPRGVAAAASGRSVEVTTPGKRRTFSASEKLRIVREAGACTERGDIEALLRREGIYSSHLAAWRKQLALHGSEALGGRKRGPKPQPRREGPPHRRARESAPRGSRRSSPSPRSCSTSKKKSPRSWGSTWGAGPSPDGRRRGHQRSNGSDRHRVRRARGLARDAVPADAAATAPERDSEGAQSAAPPRRRASGDHRRAPQFRVR